MSIHSSSNWNFRQLWQDNVPAVAIPGISAAGAIIPTAYLFERKSAYQLGQPKPLVSWKAALITGFRTAPSLGIVVGVQVLLERKIKEYVFSSPKQTTLMQDIISATITGACCVHGYAAFNNIVIGQSPWKGIKEVRLLQAGALAGREGAFVFSLSLDRRINQFITPYFGNNLFSTFLSIVASAYTINTLVHPLDSIQFLAQKNIKIEPSFKLGRGCHTRATAMVIFNLIYKTIEYLQKPA